MKKTFKNFPFNRLFACILFFLITFRLLAADSTQQKLAPAFFMNYNVDDYHASSLN